jgi:glycosyltransferase domain-containing protein
MENISIIIPTYNRPRYLRRLLDYYNQYGSDFDIIIADSSADENKALNKKIVLTFPNLKLQYVDKYSKETEPYHKFADAINYAKEKYCVFCGDDDFLVPNGLRQSVNFLEKNPDFTVAHGYYMAFLLKKGKFYWETRYPKESLISSDPKERLFEHLSKYNLPTFYGVHRTDFFKIIYRELLNSGADTVLFGEMLPSMLSVIYGKTKYLDVMYMARKIGIRADYRPTPIDYMKQGKYEAEYAKFKKCLVAHFPSEKIIDEAMAIYLKKEFSPNIKRILRAKTEKNAILNKLYKTIGFLYRLIFGGSLTNKYDFLPEYKNDFEKIKNQVTNFYE